MKATKSATGAVLAALYAAAFVAAYVYFLDNSGRWLPDIWIVLLAAPFISVMFWIGGGSYDFTGDDTAKVVAAAAFCCALAYLAGALAEAAVRALFRLATGFWRRA